MRYMADRADEMYDETDEINRSEDQFIAGSNILQEHIHRQCPAAVNQQQFATAFQVNQLQQLLAATYSQQ